MIDIRPALLEKFEKDGNKKPNPFMAALMKKKEDARNGGKKKLPFGGKKAPPFGKK